MKSKEIVKNIRAIYEKYAVPLNVQRHMREVAGVAAEICANSKEKIDPTDLIAVCLVHDLGNICKINLVDEQKINLFDEEDQKKLDFFRKKQKEFWNKYGKDDNKANELIAKELELNEKVIFLLENKAIEHKPKEFWANNFELMVLAYSDCRVAPEGVVSMQQRIEEYAKRNLFHLDKEKAERSKKFEEFAKQLEKEIFSKLQIKPQDITKESVKKYIKEFGL
jgi:hypothetical protein